VKWIDYVTNFIETNKNIPEEAYGRWIEIIAREKERESWDNASNERQTIKDHKEVSPIQTIQTESSETVISPEAVESQDTPQPNQTVKPKKTQQTEIQSKTNESELSQLIANEQIEEPNPIDYDLPADNEEMEKMIERMTAVGIKYPEASKLIKQRVKDYETAVKKFKAERKKLEQPKKSLPSAKSVRGRPRKE
jgi:hypothetical protein